MVDLPKTARTFDELLEGVRAWAKRGKRKLGAFNLTGNFGGTLDHYSKLRIALPVELQFDCHEIVFENGAWTANVAYLCEPLPTPRCKISQVLAKGPPGAPDATRGVMYRNGSWTLLVPNEQGLSKPVYDDDCEVEVERP